ncbi:phage integrase Arm DNA-binding domain-containing protein [Acinetobacter gerneri]|uniref:phage integrase Arm DNA-binding domain-containing protein n=1 Tax=Acinetobacter gerneri TaxID=202952 RepID=UPI00321469D2
MGRPRLAKNKDLPANLYRGEGKSWRYKHPITGEFKPMGMDKGKAVIAARKLNDILAPSNDLVAQVLGSISFGEFADEFLANKRRKDGRELASNSKRLYKNYVDAAKEKWAHLPIERITLLMMNQLLDDMHTTTSIGARSLLGELFDVAISKGLVKENPARATLKKYAVKQRKRHTLEGLTKIRDVADRWLKNAIDLALLTTQRRIDIVNMKWSDIHDGFLHVAQEKTTDDPEDELEISEGAGYVKIKIDSELQAVLNRCKSDNILSPFIIHRVPKMKNGRKNKVEKEHWTQVDKQYISREFYKCVKKSNAYPNYIGRQTPSFHEIRALAIFLHKKAGKSAQALAGHTTEMMTEKYATGHEIIWNEVDVGIKLPFADVT